MGAPTRCCRPRAAARRDVPLAPEDVARLRRHRLASGRPVDGTPVFAGPEGEHLSPVPAYRAFKRACRRAYPCPACGGKGQLAGDPCSARSGCGTTLVARLHDARHAYATHALAAGLTPHAVAALLGHSDAGLVLRRYGHALPAEVARAGAALSAWRRPPRREERAARPGERSG
jgi:integrase